MIQHLSENVNECGNDLILFDHLDKVKSTLAIECIRLEAELIDITQAIEQFQKYLLENFHITMHPNFIIFLGGLRFL
jgi:hypothetical protein